MREITLPALPTPETSSSGKADLHLTPRPWRIQVGSLETDGDTQSSGCLHWNSCILIRIFEVSLKWKSSQFQAQRDV